MPKDLNIYYVYILFDWCGIPRYVGFGSRNRWMHHELKTDRHNWLKNEFIEQTWIILEDIPKIKVQAKLTKIKACELEILLIKSIGRIDLGTGPLTNMSEGGTGGNFGEAIRRTKAGWTSEKRILIAQTYRKITKKWWANLSQEQRNIYNKTRSESLKIAYQHLRETDPDHSTKRNKKISLGHARRTPEEKAAAAQKRLENTTSEQRSKPVKDMWATLTPKERSIRQKGQSTTEERGARQKLAAMSRDKHEHSEQVRRQQANLTPEQQTRRAERAKRLGLGTRWITDGQSNQRLAHGMTLPENWTYGKTSRSRDAGQPSPKEPTHDLD